MDSGIKKKLGEILLDHNFITEEQLFQGIEQQKITPKKIGEILTGSGFVTEEDLARALSAQLGIPYTDINSAVVEPEAIDLLTENLARKRLEKIEGEREKKWIERQNVVKDD